MLASDRTGVVEGLGLTSQYVCSATVTCPERHLSSAPSSPSLICLVGAGRGVMALESFEPVGGYLMLQASLSVHTAAREAQNV